MSLALVLGAAAACGLAAAAVPDVVRRLPEPAPPEPEGSPRGEGAGEPEDPKEPYAAIASSRGLRAGSVLAAALLGAVLAAAVGATWSLVVLLVLVPPGVALAVVDWRTRLLPTRVIAPTYAVVVAVVLVGWAVTSSADGVVGAALGWLVAGGLYLLLWLLSPSSLGYGDVRLSGVLGLVLGHLGWGPLLVGVWSGFFLMGVVGLVLRLRDPRRRRSWPFGPFMLLGALAGVLLSPLVVP
ncbi:hypothetical protein GCM10009737_37920 [Nocardioides lentus]|uniref:Prepilin type IV endopeptidase peptidase domain-containing protein n=1 Tax=Nocardioides lentus TaxID=338077 RepID=A0ABN2PXA7_9ACTN